MDFLDFNAVNQLLDNKAFLSAVSAMAGALLTKAIAVYRERIKVLEYTVTHDRVGMSTEDAIFGSVQVTWQGHDLNNLYASTAVLENSTTVDYTNLRLKVFTGNTLLLTERTEISGTTYIPTITDAYRQSIEVPEGQAPTEAQLYTFRHNREYDIPVLNRGQRVLLTYLTTVPGGTEAPTVWLDMLHPSARLAFRQLTQQIHGVPIRVAIPLGLLAGLVVFVLASLFTRQPWVAGLICFVAGLIAQSIGAGLYRVLRFLRRLLLK